MDEAAKLNEMKSFAISEGVNLGIVQVYEGKIRVYDNSRLMREADKYYLKEISKLISNYDSKQHPQKRIVKKVHQDEMYILAQQYFVSNIISYTSFFIN